MPTVDIDLVISRAFVYGSLTAILAGVYTASIRFFNWLFTTVTGEESDLALVVSTLILATTFTPIRERLQGIAERRFRGETGEDSVAVSLADLRVELHQVS